jgi:hypothetical protein
MGSLIIQFHAVPDDMAEMIELLRNVVPKASFYLRLKSREFVNYVPELANLFAINRVDWIVASLVPIDVSCTAFDNLIDTHPASLHIEVPEIRTHFVQEVAASAKARDERGDTALKAWARFIRKFRKQLHSGAYITTSLTDEGQYYKNAHATSRAVQAAKDGLILCQASSVRYNYDRKPPLVDVMTTNSTT